MPFRPVVQVACGQLGKFTINRLITVIPFTETSEEALALTNGVLQRGIIHIASGLI